MKTFIETHPYWSLVIAGHFLTGILCYFIPTFFFSRIEKEGRERNASTILLTLLIFTGLGYLMIPVRLLIELLSADPDEEETDW